jgi:hypothetical protein
MAGRKTFEIRLKECGHDVDSPEIDKELQDNDLKDQLTDTIFKPPEARQVTRAQPSSNFCGMQ